MGLLEFTPACSRRSRPLGASWDQEENEVCCKPVVPSIIREQGLKGKRKGRIRQKTTNSKHAHPIAQNKLERAFDASKPDLKWASDITYLPTTEGWLYLRE